MSNRSIAPKPVPPEFVKALLARAINGYDSEENVVVDAGAASQILEGGNFSDYLAYRSFCGDGGTVSFSLKQLQEDAKKAPDGPVVETVTPEGRISANGTGPKL